LTWNFNKGYIITKSTEYVYKNGDYSVEAIPCWKYWGIKNKV